MDFRRIEQLFASSIGSAIHQIKMQSGAGIVATSFAGNEIQKRSYPNSFGGQHMLAGYELVESLDLVGNAPRVAEEAVALHSAAHSPEGTKTIILESSQLGLQIHESIGHPIELDRVLGMEANFAGMSFLTLGKARQAALWLGHRQRGGRRAAGARPGPRHIRIRRRRRSRAVHADHHRTACSPATCPIAKRPHPSA